MAEHRGIRWALDHFDMSDTWACVSYAGWEITSPLCKAGDSDSTEADAIRACDFLADIRDGIDLRSQLDAVIADRDEGREALHHAAVRVRTLTLERDEANKYIAEITASFTEMKAERDAALAAAGVRARLGRLVLGALDRLRGGGE